MSWNPAEHSDQNNLTWSWGRAVEWGRWPVFLSQPVAPILFLFFSWKAVIVGVVIANLMWAFVRYRFVSVPLVSLGAILVKLKWLTIPYATLYLFLKGAPLSASLSLFWPALILITGAIPTTQVGRIQNMLMSKLGDQSAAPTLQVLKSELASLTWNADVSEQLIKKARRRYPHKSEIEIYVGVIETYKDKHNKR